MISIHHARSQTERLGAVQYIRDVSVSSLMYLLIPDLLQFLSLIS